MQLSDLYDLEGSLSNQFLLTTGGQLVEVTIDEGLSKSLIALWEHLGIPNIES